MPGPPGLPVIGNIWRFLPLVGEWGSMDFLEIQWDLYRKYGKIVSLGKLNENKEFVSIFDPAEIEKVYRHEGPWPKRNGFESLDYYRRKMYKEKFQDAYGLLSTNEKEWQDFRRRVQPHMLQPKTVAKYTAPIDQVSGELIQRFREIRDNNYMLPGDSIKWFFRWSFESIALIALDARMGCLEARLAADSEAQRLIEAVHVLMDSFFELDVKPSPWRYVTTPAWRRFVKAVDIFEQIAQKSIDLAVERMRAKVAAGQELGDDLSVLERLLLANDNPRIATTMATDMMFGGIDTTSYSSAILLYYLAKNPDKQEKLFEELRDILPRPDTPVTPEALQKMKYLRACIKESMRLKPVVIGQIRENTRDDLVLGNYKIPKGPERFLPERWLKGESHESKGHPFATLPFGFGTRMCIGKRFAELEIEVLNAKSSLFDSKHHS
ncbi:Putative cytochrome P450 301a1, mitochondrial [Gryllus bimaculatus]|nr:Putative cytochrome P450 301a1, mitochondrial [Gryllus bimaculatus]